MTSRRAASRTDPRTASKAASNAASRANPKSSRLAGSKTELLFGRHAVAAALANPERVLQKLYVTSEDMVREFELPKSLPVAVGTRPDLDRLLASRGIMDAVHQGVALATEPLREPALDDILENTDGPLVLLDQVTDPHNIGAILRSAAVFGAAAIITTDRHAPHESGTLAKAASGALERVPLVRVVNLARALETVRKAGYWRLGLAEAGAPLRSFREKFTGEKVALVMGAEGPGLRRLTREQCDLLVSLPTAGQGDDSFTTLNVSNAAAVALYAITQD